MFITSRKTPELPLRGFSIPFLYKVAYALGLAAENYLSNHLQMKYDITLAMIDITKDNSISIPSPPFTTVNRRAAFELYQSICKHAKLTL